MDVLERFSCEFQFSTDAEGRVLLADARAKRHGFLPGADWLSLCVPGSVAKARQLLQIASTGHASSELGVVLDSKPQTLCLSLVKEGDSFACLGRRVSDELQRVAKELKEALDHVLEQNRQIARQKRELHEAHQGVLALHEELQERAERLAESAEIKSRVVANVSHELRTPLHSILGLSRLLLDRVDGPLTTEQEKQARFIRSSAEELSVLVNDMLDLSQLYAGKMSLRSERFDLGEFLTALRGMVRPLLLEEATLRFVCDEPKQPIQLETDRGKLSQILRNLLSNAIKFTDRGEVRLSTEVAGGRIVFRVSDTGVGIAEHALERIFEEFTQVDNRLQARVKGSGLGLSLARQLAERLGGRLEVTSVVDKGSVFTLTIPLVHEEVVEMQSLQDRAKTLDPARAPVLVVEDDRKTIFVYERYLTMGGFQVMPARTIAEAQELLKSTRPAAIVLDVMLEGETTWDFLAKLKHDPDTRDIPVLVVTISNREKQARALGADEFWLKPLDQDRLIKKLRKLVTHGRGATVLTIDDDEKARYLVKSFLAGTPYRVLEAGDGHEGVAIARAERPDVILLDFLLRGMTAFDVLDILKGDPSTRSIPVIIATSMSLPDKDRARLSETTEGILAKDSLSRELAIQRIRDALQKAGVGSAK